MLSSNLIAALRGPVVLTTLGVLLVLSNQEAWHGRAAFKYTWPALVIIYGLFKLLEALGSREAAVPPPMTPPMTGGPQQ